MSQRLPKPMLRFFTMIELIAVITITAILLTITMKVVKVDPTKANASVVAASLNYAQAYAMTSLKEEDEFIEVHIEYNDKITINYYEDNTSTAEVVEKYSLRKGSSYSVNGSTTTGSEAKFYFNYKGEPIEEVALASIDTGELETNSSNLVFYIHDPSDIDDNQIPVYIKPFTGKIAFY